MPVYDTILDAETDPDQPLKSSLAKRWSNNFLAALEGDPTAVAAGVTLKDAALDAGAATAAGTTWVALRMAAIAAGAVGSYVIASELDTTTTGTFNRALGATLAGSGLASSNVNGTSIGGSLSGTWRLMGRSQYGSTSSASSRISLWLRIS